MHRFNLAGFFFALMGALTLAGASFARPPLGPRHFHRSPGTLNEENVETLGLDEETLTAIRNIIEESRDTGDQLHAELRELHQGMKELLSQETPDESAVMQQVETIGALETEMHKHRLGTMLKIRALLTSEQREELIRIREESRGHWRRALLEACEADLEAVCPEAEDRWSRKQCLHEHHEELSTACQDAIDAASRARHDFPKGHSRPGF